jgi:hypothetical protein
MKERNQFGQMFVDKNGKTSGKRVIGTIGALASLGMGYVQLLSSKDNDYTTMILGLFTASVALIAASIAEKKDK